MTELAQGETEVTITVTLAPRHIEALRWFRESWFGLVLPPTLTVAMLRVVKAADER